MVYTEPMAHDEMTLKDAMEFLGIKSRITMRKYANKGVIPTRRIWRNGGSWRVFKKADLKAFKLKMVKEPSSGMSFLPLEPKPSRKK